MPELPEVEIIARGLRAMLLGTTVLEVPHFRSDYVVCPNGDPAKVLTGRSLAAVGRHGKRLCLTLDPPGEMFIHLGMSGRVDVVPGDSAVDPHTHLRVRFQNRTDELRLVDPRRFGGVWVSGIPSDGDRPDPLSIVRNGAHPGRLGPDALSIGLREFRSLMARQRQVKALLLDQGAIAGLGNIYVDEALWAAEIHPETPAHDVPNDVVRKLRTAMLRILNRAIEHGGSTLRDYRNASGGRGAYQRRHRVYGREGEACGRCRSEIVRETVAGRSTHYCPGCQR